MRYITLEGGVQGDVALLSFPAQNRAHRAERGKRRSAAAAAAAAAATEEVQIGALVV